VRGRLIRILGKGEEKVTLGQLPFTVRFRKATELAIRQALAMGHSYVNTEHLLLALLSLNEGCAARLLLDFDLDSEQVREAVMLAISGSNGMKPKVQDPNQGTMIYYYENGVLKSVIADNGTPVQVFVQESSIPNYTNVQQDGRKGVAVWS
jgi:ATP-dependent Clp protease ATP-binding subunit ClpA